MIHVSLGITTRGNIFIFIEGRCVGIYKVRGGEGCCTHYSKDVCEAHVDWVATTESCQSGPASAR